VHQHPSDLIRKRVSDKLQVVKDLRAEGLGIESLDELQLLPMLAATDGVVT
jgi:hypothetical protein